MENIMIPKARLDRIERILNKIEQAKNLDDLINEDEACKLLNIGKGTIRNYISLGRIPADCYTQGVSGNRFYYRSKLMGIK